MGTCLSGDDNHKPGNVNAAACRECDDMKCILCGDQQRRRRSGGGEAASAALQAKATQEMNGMTMDWHYTCRYTEAAAAAPRSNAMHICGQKLYKHNLGDGR